MVNKCILLGNVGKDPEVNTLESGNKYAKFSLATSRKYKDKEGEVKETTQWHNIIIWGKLADVVEKYVTKGSRLYLEGEIQYRSYETQDKVTKYITEINAFNMQMVGGGNSNGQPAAGEPAAEGDDVDDLPF